VWRAQLNVEYEVINISQINGWIKALETNNVGKGTLKLPIYMQGDRIYWGKV
jgi:hypothetical protein